MNNVDPTTDRIDHTPWCEKHAYDADNVGWCSTRHTEIAGCTLNVSTGTTDGTAKLFGLYEVDEVITLDDAERITSTLLALLEQVRPTVDDERFGDVEQYLSVDGASRALGCTRYDVEQLIATSKVAAVACGPMLMVCASDVEQLGGAL